MYSGFLNHIAKFIQLDNEETAILLHYLQHKILRKKEFLLKEGQICKANYFVIKGCLSMYYVNKNGKDQVIQFAIDNWWITDYISLDRQTASGFYIRAVEPSEIIVLDKRIEKELFDKIPKLDRYFRLILQKGFGAYQQKIKYIFDMSGEERYHHFNNSFPEFVQRVPQYMLASFLGFTPEFLSKVRAKKL